MKKFITMVGYTVLALLILVLLAYLYIFREQEIEVGYIPNEFEYCGKKIYGTDKEYKKIVSWLKSNKKGWVASFVSFVPNQVYSHPAFKLNIMAGSVAVSYKTDYGYPQYVKVINHGLELTCK